MRTGVDGNEGIVEIKAVTPMISVTGKQKLIQQTVVGLGEVASQDPQLADHFEAPTTRFMRMCAPRFAVRPPRRPRSRSRCVFPTVPSCDWASQENLCRNSEASRLDFPSTKIRRRK